MKKPRNYKKEYENYQGSEKQKANRASRGRARYKLQTKGRVTIGDGKDVDHKDGNPKNNSSKNLRVTSKAFNRSKNKRSSKKLTRKK